MSDDLYNYSLLCAWPLLFIFSFILIFGQIPKSSSLKGYNRTRMIIGIAMALHGLQILIQWLFQFRSRNAEVAAAIYLSCIFLMAILYGMGYISLLDKNYINKRQLISDFSHWLFTCCIIWIATLFFKGNLLRTCQVIAALIFVLYTARIIIIFFKTYHQTKISLDNYYSDNVSNFIHWLYISVYGIIFFGLIGAVLAFSSRLMVGIYMTAGIGMFTYIFYSLLNYAFNCEYISSISQETPHQEDKPFIKRQLDQNLKKWCQQGGYRQSGITIENIASMCGTNRSYISQYFNKDQHTTFRDWINDLRMNDAKELLLKSNNYSIEQIADMTGFSGKSYFITLFKQREKTTPSEWKKNMLKSISKEQKEFNQKDFHQINRYE